ncbi:zinc ABC transporter substrate-binding protein [Lachnospiraceae bacterium BX10]|uniref:Zinc ABC transporter substrate-binding protein n=1 Tax=Enterocloster hominis (ex Liu et al. 2021) TaxID=2763663 RepID=A0ABR7NWA5_9FIRM|nr:metal ABC transporter substrate-binding protein [Enterocloster hominis]MBC8599891.1 zinc ABC transporter substrate-binding protein [Enterocloster hominis]
MFLFCLLSGCGRAESGEEPGDGEGGRKLKVAATLFPYYDFVRQVAGDQVELSLVIPAGMDSHSFEPTPRDIRTMQEADVIIANGGAMEHWVDQVVDSFDREDQTVVIMMDHVDAVEEEIVEGMEHSDEGHGHVHVHEDGEEDGHLEEDESQYEIEYDEHIWTSPVNAMRMVDVIAETLTERDPDHGAMYQAGAAAYLEELERLDKEFREVRDSAVHDMIVMGDKFPLRYFADTYGLRYRAAFSGCSSDTEPSARTIAYLIDKVKEEGLPVIYYLELSSHRVAEIIGEETGAVPLLFHSCHNVTRRQFEEGVTYLELMEQNVKNLREGLCK